MIHDLAIVERILECGQNRVESNYVDAKLAKVGKTRRKTGQIAVSVAVGILVAGHKHFIEDGVLVPAR